MIGQEVTDNTQREVARELAKIEPTAVIDVNYIRLNKHKYIISLETRSGHYAPYIYDNRAYQRNQSTTSQMSQHRYEQLLLIGVNLIMLGIGYPQLWITQ